MISSEAFVLSLGLLLGILATWAFKRLPDERWQFLASVPIMKDASGRWHGLNFTYYGLLTANALVFGVGLLIVLLGSLHVPTTVTVALILAVLLLCLPAAKWVARLVEGKSCTFTVAGAFFVGIFVTPVVLHFVNLVLPQVGLSPVPIVPALAAVMIAYTFGEALGRLACISFGCCYGVSISKAHPILQKVLGRRHFVFSGKMKKISYASGMEGMQVVPIQAMTSLVYILAGLAATFLFLKGSFGVAFIVTIAVTQGWRSLSETLRADYRGDRPHIGVSNHGGFGYLSCPRSPFPPSSRARHRAGPSGGYRSGLASGGGPLPAGSMGDSLCIVREKYGYGSRDFLSPPSRSNLESGPSPHANLSRIDLISLGPIPAGCCQPGLFMSRRSRGKRFRGRHWACVLDRLAR